MLPGEINILFVEDDALIRHTVVSALRQCGPKSVRSATDGIDAIRSLNAEMPDCVISDWVMPNSGLDLLLRMKASPDFKYIPVIIVSGEDGTEWQEDALRHGAFACLKKPFNPKELFQTIKRAIAAAKKP